MDPAMPPTRSMVADRPSAAAQVTRRRRAHPNGLWGMTLFLCSEITIFGTLISTYFYLDFQAGRWPPAGIKPPEIAPPSAATGWLLLSAIPMWLASRAARAGNRSATWWAIAAGLLMHASYLAAQVYLFGHDLHQFSPKGSAYGSIYFTLLAADHAHVALGIALDLGLLLFLATRGLRNYWLVGTRALSLYWYVVIGITILVLCTQLTPSY